MADTSSESIDTSLDSSVSSSSVGLDLEGALDRITQESYKTALFLQVSAECNTIVTGASVVSSVMTNNNKEISKVATKTYTSG
ncbi:MAG: hypothetical protein PVJ84_08680 [Desulfobacteraceae bacterium]|jgi:hypothetical protein